MPPRDSHSPSKRRRWAADGTDGTWAALAGPQDSEDELALSSSDQAETLRAGWADRAALTPVPSWLSGSRRRPNAD